MHADEVKAYWCIGAEITILDETVNLNQFQLIARSLMLGFKNSDPKDTLVVKPALDSNANGKERTSTSCVLFYIAGRAGPDTSMAICQVATFSTNKAATHISAPKLFGNYLLGSTEKWSISQPDVSKGLEVFEHV